MMTRNAFLRFSVVVLTAVACENRVQAEDLRQAWEIALGVNQGLQAQQTESISAGLNLAASKSARMPSLRTTNYNAFLTGGPNIQTSGFTGSSRTGTSTGTGSGTTSSLPASISLLGSQRDIPISLSYVTQPIYTGGRLSRSIDQAKAQLGVQRTTEFRTALDLKLTVAESYVGVLRAQKNLDTARSNVQQLDSFARDTTNRRVQGLAIRSDELAAEVSLANARVSEITAKTNLQSAWATYNRYLCRPLSVVVPLDQITMLPMTTDPKVIADEAVLASKMLARTDEAEVAGLTDQAMRSRPELANLSEQARSLNAQADITRAAILPQINFSMAYVFLGLPSVSPQGIGAATFSADWLITDFGTTRRRAAAYRQQESAALKRRNDTAADIALEVRTRWLDLVQAKQQVPVTRLAILQSEENSAVVTNRYRQQLSTYTEVLDAETRRIQSLNNFYNAIYNENLAQFRLRRSVGDL